MPRHSKRLDPSPQGLASLPDPTEIKTLPPTTPNAYHFTQINLMYKLDTPPLLFESSRPGRSTSIFPASDVPTKPLATLMPATALADGPPPLPELGELDVVRHYMALSTLNMSIDSNF